MTKWLCVQRKRGPRTEPWGTPVVRLQGHKHRFSPIYPVSAVLEVGYEQGECRALDFQSLESGEEDLVVHCVKCYWKIQQDEDDIRLGICSSNVEFLYDGKEGSFCWVARLEFRLVRVEEVVQVEICRQLSKDSTLKCFWKKLQKREKCVILNIRRNEGRFLQERAHSSCFKSVWKTPVVKEVLMRWMTNGRRSGTIAWRRWEGIGSRGQAVERWEVTKVSTSIGREE